MHVAFGDWKIKDSACATTVISALSGWRWDAGWESYSAVEKFCLNSPGIWGCCWEIGFPACECWNLTTLLWFFYELPEAKLAPCLFVVTAKNGLTLSSWQSRNSLNLAMSNHMSDKPKRKDAFTVCSISASFMYCSIAVTPSSGFCLSQESHCAANLLTSTSKKSGMSWIDRTANAARHFLTNSGSG